MTEFIHPPERGSELSHAGKAANKPKGNASAVEKPNITTVGPILLVADSTIADPIMGPVQENETKARVNAIKKVPINPPRSGGWMNSVKVILGFLELAFAFKFLSVADMTSHWGFLRYELFLAIWIIIGALMAIYLFGGIKFPHDSPKIKLSVPRISFALIAVAFTVYCALGFRPDDKTKTYDSLSVLSGIVPPPHYNFFKPLPEPDPVIKARYPSFDKCANNLDCFKDYYEALSYAKEVNKPVFIDFTGYGCVNCRKVEDQIWVKDRVWKLLASDYVMASLYVDDRKKLEEIKYSSTTGEKMRDVGDLWADFQIANFRQNSQPLYVLITPDQEVLSIPKTYVPSESFRDYADYLECGLNQFEKFYNNEVIGLAH